MFPGEAEVILPANTPVSQDRRPKLVNTRRRWINVENFSPRSQGGAGVLKKPPKLF